MTSTRGRAVLAALGLMLLFASSLATAQSITTGAIRGVVATPDGEPVPGASVTVELGGGGQFRNLDAADDGSFRLELVPPGAYHLLIEQAGFQPIRLRGVLVSGGQVTVVAITIERRPPPITTVVEREASFVLTGSDPIRLLSSREAAHADRWLDLAGAARSLSEISAADDGAVGLRPGSQGFAAPRVVIDGVELPALRHPGHPGLGLSLPAFGRLGLAQIGVLGNPRDVEWRAGGGAILAAQTGRGGNRIHFAPHLFASSSQLGGQVADNPADSSATSFQVGASLSGAIRPDTAAFYLRFDYQNVRTPSPFPFDSAAARFQGGQAPLLATIRSIADGYGQNVESLTAPPVRRWRAASGSGGIDWRLSAVHSFGLRVAAASLDERSPAQSEVAGFGPGVSVTGRDLSAVASLASSGGSVANEARIGFSSVRRTWAGSTLPATILSEAGVGFGGQPIFPATFQVTQFDLSDAFQVAAGQHQIKLGGAVRLTDYGQTYAFGATPTVVYPGLDGFGANQGSVVALDGAVEPVGFTVVAPRVFLQDAWSLSPEVTITAGVTYDVQRFPAGTVIPNPAWLTASGIATVGQPLDKKGLGGRGGFVWNVRNLGKTVVRGGIGVAPGELDFAQFAEAVGSRRVRRAVGSLANWPQSATAGTVADRITLFSDTYRAPRTFRVDGGLTQSLGAGGSLALTGLFSHTDFLLRRVDLNRITSPVATTTEDRPVYATLAKFDGLVVPRPGSGRRFSAFDHVFGLAPTGYSDYYEVSARLEKRLGAVGVDVAYTWSRTRDNRPGMLSPDPADQLSPFPDGLAGGADWTVGQSDLDIPHRVVGGIEFRGSGSMAPRLGIRGRWRSGLGYTPGLPLGVDLNGDGSAANDPAPILASVAGLSAALAAAGCSTTGTFAVRNSCRADGVGALDVHLSIGLPTGTRPVRLVVDGFNLVVSSQGIVDRALVTIDPTQPLSTTTAGRLLIPLAVNPRFGKSLARIGEPRWIRVGLRLE